ncbi:hypothetical protein P3339_16015 [Microbulbifer sp. MLAF003]|uniref:hypothetical protein n=1 Tax=Microbulbifer sp. MLAF003 TaxID=3032582 RepID=UPI0024AE1BDD|nr:hypothetical protein [Microbulbifer sp. MLAF003]WHI49949.1 hypothetical protein P3339_16015 [Microbulbifer sp. MLAF003]
MKFSTHYIIVFTVFILSFASTIVRGDDVNISGVVVDDVSGFPLGKVNVELYLFEQGSIFKMGTYKLFKQVESSDEGRFDFAVEEGESIQIKTKNSGAPLYGGLITIDKVSQDKSDIVIRHKSNKK